MEQMRKHSCEGSVVGREAGLEPTGGQGGIQWHTCC